MKRFAYVSFFTLLFAACAHHKDVRPGAEGIHSISVTAENTQAGARDALKQANHFCGKRDKSAAITKENKKYTGDMDEKTYKKAKRVSKVAETVGGAAWVFGGRKESDIGGVVGLGGAAADKAIGKGYTVEMQFKCI